MPVDERIARVAGAQHGSISAFQIRRCGLTTSTIERRVRAGQLHRLHRGVYMPGHRRLPPLGWVAASVLVCGARACASHLTAAHMRELRSSSRTLVDVAVPSPSGRCHGHVVTHSARRLRPGDVSVVDGIPATSVARTLLDCAPSLGRRGTEKLVAEAEHRGTIRSRGDRRAHGARPGSSRPGHPARGDRRRIGCTGPDRGHLSRTTCWWPSVLPASTSQSAIRRWCCLGAPSSTQTSSGETARSSWRPILAAPTTPRQLPLRPCSRPQTRRIRAPDHALQRCRATSPGRVRGGGGGAAQPAPRAAYEFRPSDGQNS